MNKQFGNDDPALASYLFGLYQAEDPELREIRERSLRAGLPDIQVAALDARHLEVLTRLAGARRAVEIGTLAGYSGLAIVRGLAPDGRLDTCEIDPAHARVAEETFAKAGVAGRVRIHLGPALESLRAIERQGDGPVDLCFIDADKESYPQYLDWAARNLRRGGVMVADNVFLFGHLADPGPGNESLQAMRAFHQRLATSGEFRATVIPTGEGLSLAVRL
jgi:caffeoyl-CoA O-methyltransferase